MTAFTDLEQSKKLAEILPLESADMCWTKYIDNGDITSLHTTVNYGIVPIDTPCWSLAALLNYLREIDFFPDIDADEHSVTMSINYYDENEGKILCLVPNIKVEADNFIDACVEMIVELKEKGLI